MPWPLLWSRIVDLLEWQTESGRIDAPRLVDALARLRTIEVLPRQKWPVPRRLWLIRDHSYRLMPFWKDQQQVELWLREHLGRDGVISWTFPFGPTESFDAFARSAPSVPAGTPALVLSDLGSFAGPSESERWEAFGDWLRRRGHVPAALVAAPRERWPGFVSKWRARVWDRSPGRGHGGDPLQTLMGLLVPAIRVEPGLLRALRLLVSGADVGTEYDAWSRMRGVSAAAATPPPDRDLDSWREPQPLQLEALSCIRAWHKEALPPEIWFQELLGLPAGSPAHSVYPDDVRAGRRELALLANGVAGEIDDDEIAAALRAWFEEMRASVPDALFADHGLLGAALRGALERIDPGHASEPASQTWSVSQSGGTLRWTRSKTTEPASSPLGIEHAGRPRVLVGKRLARATEDRDGALSVDLSSGAGRASDGDRRKSISFRTRDVEHRIENVERPIWACAMGRDPRGLWAELEVRGVTTRVRWHGPRVGGAGRVVEGFWVSEEPCTEAFVHALGRGSTPISPRESKTYIVPPRSRSGEDSERATPPARTIEGLASDRFWRRASKSLPHLRLRHLGVEEMEAHPKLIETPKYAFRVAVDSDAPRVPHWADNSAWDRWGLYADVDLGVARARMRWIPPGRFQMGSPTGEAGREDDEVQHAVELTTGFWLGDTPCTQAFWEALAGNNPSGFVSPDRPVEQVSFDEVEEFLKRANAKRPGLELRLPTEAEWEYACRSGTTTATYAGDLEILGDNEARVLDSIGWYGGNCGVGFELENGYDVSGWHEKQYDVKRGGTHAVALKRPNDWGLFDTLGNVWEWCADWYGFYEPEGQTDPVGRTGGSERVLRGGSWDNGARSVRAALRGRTHPDYQNDLIGFRLARGQE
ncbi:MAG: formylglycine-generating enzyme family protein [bacterium]|nr:formylglycine-generating enzyme family protein [bacterium]